MLCAVPLILVIFLPAISAYLIPNLLMQTPQTFLAAVGLLFAYVQVCENSGDRYLHPIIFLIFFAGGEKHIWMLGGSLS